MAYFIPRFLRFDGYKTIDVATSFKKKSVVVKLEVSEDKPFHCHICKTALTRYVHTKIRRVKDLPIRLEALLQRLSFQGALATAQHAKSKELKRFPLSRPYRRITRWNIRGGSERFVNLPRLSEAQDLQGLII